MDKIKKISNQVVFLSKLKEMVIVAIDGMPGGGKSTLMRHLLKYLPDVQVVKTDSFFDFDKNENDLERLKKEVLISLKKGQVAQYKIYDWKQKRVVDAKPLHPKGIIFIEGICSLDKELIGFYDYKVWVKASPSIGLSRVLLRDNGSNRVLWEEKWIPETLKYIEEQKPEKEADLIINSEGIPMIS